MDERNGQIHCIKSGRDFGFDNLAGCRMVVVVNPRNHALKVYRRQSDMTVLCSKDVFDGGDVVPGFRLPAERIFDVGMFEEEIDRQ